jgi:hypothetical protein
MSACAEAQLIQDAMAQWKLKQVPYVSREFSLLAIISLHQALGPF